jgi:hypothetical protein
MRKALNSEFMEREFQRFFGARGFLFASNSGVEGILTENEIIG